MQIRSKFPVVFANMVSRPIAKRPLGRLVEPGVPPYGLRHGMRELRRVSVRGVDQDIAFDPRWDRRDHQKRGALLTIPSVGKGLADGLVLRIPARMRSRLENLIAYAVRNGDGDEMLVRRQHHIGMHQLLQHRRRIMFGCVDDWGIVRVPATGIEPCALGVVDRIGAVRIADAIAGENAICLLYGHTPPL